MDIKKALKDSYTVMSKDLLEFRRNHTSLVLLFLMPLILLVMTGFIFPSGSTQQHMPVGLVDLDHGSGSVEFTSQLEATNKNTGYMDFSTFSSADDAKTAILKGKLYGAYIIPPGFSYNVTHGQSANVVIYVDNSYPQLAAQIQQVASDTVTSLSGAKAETNVQDLGKAANESVNPEGVVFPYVPDVTNTIPGKTNYFNFLAPGIMIMVVMMAVMSGIPEAISKEKELGTFDGMLSAPVSQVSIIVGKTLALCKRIHSVHCRADTGSGTFRCYHTWKYFAGIFNASNWHIQLYRPGNYGHIPS